MSNREQEYRELFTAEALETAEALGRHLAELERAPADAAADLAVAESFRLLHNLKASAAATGMPLIADLAHALETVFDRLRSRELPFTAGVATALYSGADALSDLVREAAGPSTADEATPSAELTTLLERLASLTATTAAAPTRPLAPALETTGEPAAKGGRLELSDLISIPVRKLNTLLTLAGELMLDRDRLRTIARELDHPALTQVADHLYRLAEDIQFSVMDARLVTVGSLFNKFPRVVRDVAVASGKLAVLDVQGQDIQVDRNVLQLVTDALLHLLRNAVAHGLETPAARLAAGKPEAGQLQLGAETDRDRVIITVRDDGQGIDPETIRRQAVRQGLITEAESHALDPADVLNLIFEPGFSTAHEITEFAGRGVGLDVVKLAVEGLGGHLRLTTTVGQGTTFTLTLPASLAVKPALLVDEEGTSYAIPLTYTENVVSLRAADLFVAGPVLMAGLSSESEEAVPVVPLRHLLAGPAGLRRLTDRSGLGPGPYPVVIVQHNARRVGLLVERFLGQQDIVVKPVARPLDQIDLYNGLTTLGNGRVCVVLDIPALTRPFTVGRDTRQLNLPTRTGSAPASLLPQPAHRT